MTTQSRSATSMQRNPRTIKGSPYATPEPVTTSQDSEPCHLLNLPPEIRNCIYRGALLETRDIHIGRTHHEQSGLLRTCRQIRREAYSIYVRENSFRFQVLDMKPALPLFSTGHWVLKRSKSFRSWKCVCVGVNSTVSHWNDLKAWLKNWVDQELPRPPRRFIAGDHARMVLQSIFDAVEHMRNADLGWQLIEPVVESMRAAICGAQMDHSRTWS